MSNLRSLPDVAAAARRLGLDVVPTLLPEVLFTCPVCKRHGARSLARVEMVIGAPVVTCAGCERWDDDPFAILGVLGHDPDKGEPHEVALRVFDLMWAMHRHGVTT